MSINECMEHILSLGFLFFLIIVLLLLKMYMQTYNNYFFNFVCIWECDPQIYNPESAHSLTIVFPVNERYRPSLLLMHTCVLYFHLMMWHGTKVGKCLIWWRKAVKDQTLITWMFFSSTCIGKLKYKMRYFQQLNCCHNWLYL